MKKGNFARNVLIVVLFFLTFWFGIRPIITGEEFERKTGKASGPAGKNQYALVVFGTEPEGIVAALSASRMGLKTLLVTEDLDPGESSNLVWLHIHPRIIPPSTGKRKG